MNSNDTLPDFSDATGGSSSAAFNSEPIDALVLKAPPAVADSIKYDVAGMLKWRSKIDGTQLSQKQIEDEIQQAYKPGKTVMNQLSDGLKQYFIPIGRSAVKAGAQLTGAVAGLPVDAARLAIAAANPQLKFDDVPGAEAGLAGAGPRAEAAANLVGPPPTTEEGAKDERVLTGISSFMMPLGPMNKLATTVPAMLSQMGAGAASELAGEAARDRGASPFVTWLASTVGALTGGVVPFMGAWAPAMKGVMGKVAEPEVAAAYHDLGVEPNPTLMSAPTSLANRSSHMVKHMAGGGAPIFTMAQKIAMGIRTSVDDIVSKVGGGSGGSATAGGEAAAMAPDRFRLQMRQRGQAAWGKVAQLTPPTREADALHTLGQALNEVWANTGKPPRWQDLEAEAYFKDLTNWLHLGSDRRSTVGDLLVVRRAIGEDMSKLGAPGQVNVEYAKLRRMYAAVSNDILAAMQTPAERRAWKNANQITKQDHKTLEKIILPLQAKGTPEAAFNYMMGEQKDGATRFEAIYRTLTPTQKNLVSAVNLERLGMAPGGGRMDIDDFNPMRFLANYDKVRPEVWAVMSKDWPPEARQMLESSVIVARKQRANTSHLGQSTTASATSFASALKRYGTMITSGAGGGYAVGGLPGAAMGAAGGAVVATGTPLAARVVSEMLTSPLLFSWMMKQSTLPASMLAGQVNALKQMALKIGDDEAYRAAIFLQETAEPGEQERTDTLRQSGGSTVTSNE